MKEKIRKMLLETNHDVFISPKNFAGWIIEVRQQENLLNRNSNESLSDYNHSKEFLEELFWQIVCLRYTQLLKIPEIDQNFNRVEDLIKKYRGLDSIEILLPLHIDRKELMYCAWDVAKEIDALVNESSDFVERNKDIDNFFYHLRHWSGHGVRPELRRFASNLSRDLKH